MKSFLTQQFLDPRQDYKKMSNDGGQENKICMNYVVNQHIIFRCTRKNKRLHFILMRKLICSPMSEMSEDTNNMQFIFFLCVIILVWNVIFFARFVIENKRFSFSFCASFIFQQKIF